MVALGEQRRAREQVTKFGELYRAELGLPLPEEARRALSEAGTAADSGTPANAATVHPTWTSAPLHFLPARWTAGSRSCASPSNSPNGRVNGTCWPRRW